MGSFISADPLLVTSDPAQLGGYTYAGDNPVTNSDPSGLRVDPEESGCEEGNGGSCNGHVTPDLDDDEDGGDEELDPIPTKDNGDGTGSVGGVKVTVDQLRVAIHVYGFLVNDNYHRLRNSLGSEFDALSDERKLLWAMDLACGTMKICEAVYANEVHNQQAVTAVKAGGFDTQAASDAKEAGSDVNGAGGGPSSIAKMAKPTKNTIETYNALKELAQGVKKACIRHNSFSPETLVLLADGTTKPIAEIEVGDEVLATDPETGETDGERVEALHVNVDSALVDLVVGSADGRAATIHTTAEHPFWIPERQQWIDAGTVRPGDYLGAQASQDPVKVGTVSTFIGRRTMYNLTVADLHTYYVLAGTTPVLVHKAVLSQFRRVAGITYGIGMLFVAASSPTRASS